MFTEQVDVAGQLRVYPGQYKVQVTDAPPQYFQATGSAVTVGAQI